MNKKVISFVMNNCLFGGGYNNLIKYSYKLNNNRKLIQRINSIL